MQNPSTETVPPSSTRFQPKDAAFDSRVRDSFARQALMRTIGAELMRVEPGRIEIALPFRVDLTQQHGYLHAGITSTIADRKRTRLNSSHIPLSRMPSSH